MPVSTSQASANGINSLFANNPYFKAQDQSLPVAGFGGSPYTKLVPNASVVDVVEEMYWSNPSENKEEVPSIFLREKELQYGAWATQLSTLLTTLGQGTAAAAGAVGSAIAGTSNLKNVDSYVQLYSAQETGFYYNIPWLLKSGDSLRNINNSWNSISGLGDLIKNSNSNKKQEESGLFGAVAGGVAGAVVGALTPGFGFEDTKQYESTTQNSVTVTFPLYNTIDVQTAYRHFCFTNLFTFQNLKTRTSLMTFIPPKIYEVDAYATGGLYMAAAYVSDLKIDSIGTTRAISDSAYGGYILIPEAYKVSITFTDLLSQSSNVFAGVLGGTKVQVTNGGQVVTGLANAAQAGVNTINNGLAAGVNGLKNLIGITQ